MSRVVRFVLHALLSAIPAASAQAPPPADGPTPNYARVYEFYNSILGQYFRTASPAEAAAIDSGASGPGWKRTGDDFYAYLPGSHAPGADVCRFYSRQSNTHFYTASVEECDSLRTWASGWRYEGLAFRLQVPSVALRCPPVTIPVYRLYNDGGHRFTINADNVGLLRDQGWIYEGIAFCALNLDAVIVHPY